MNSTTGAVGAFLLMFGFLFLTISSSVVYVVFSYNDPVPQLELALAAILIASVGAGLLFHGVLSRKQEPEEKPGAETPENV